jgi:tRNA (guanosine-2'-O-)-methyltransferase
MLPKRFHRLRSVLRRRQPDLTVLMERVHKEHNLSAILRNCDAVGVLEVHAVPPEGGLTVHHDTSGGTAKWIPVHRHPSVEAGIRRLQATGHQVVAAHPSPDALDFREVDYTRPTAILMGAELWGLSEEALERADVSAVIPMMGMTRSLNVSVATALLLYEAQRQRQARGMYVESRLPPHRFHRVLFEWAYPELAPRYRAAGMPYPELTEDGAIDGPPPPGPTPRAADGTGGDRDPETDPGPGQG